MSICCVNVNGLPTCSMRYMYSLFSVIFLDLLKLYFFRFCFYFIDFRNYVSRLKYYYIYIRNKYISFGQFVSITVLYTILLKEHQYA